MSSVGSLESILQFNWVDVIVLVIVLRAGYMGSLRGMVMECIRVLTLALALGAGTGTLLFLAPHLAKWFPQTVRGVEAFAFFSITLVAWFLLAVGARILGHALKQHAVNSWNQALGVTLGLGAGMLMAGMVAWGIASVPATYLMTSVLERSATGALVVQLVQRVVRQCLLLTGQTAPASEFLGALFS